MAIYRAGNGNVFVSLPGAEVGFVPAWGWRWGWLAEAGCADLQAGWLWVSVSY